MTRTCEARQLKFVTYENGLKMQDTLVALRQRDELPDQLLLLEHTPVITLGRGGDRTNLLASPEELSNAGVRFVETTRGGDITYHGPGQLVCYPILHLGEGRRDVRRYVTALEEVVIRVLEEFGIRGERSERDRGVWVGSEKIAAMGVRIARWVSSHGFALNIDPDLAPFRMITPCGLRDRGVTSIANLNGSSPGRAAIEEALIRHFSEVFERAVEIRQPVMRLIKVVIHDGAKVLLLHRHRHRGDFWQPITGGIEPGESPLDAARREILEETGQEGEPVDGELEQSFLIESRFLEKRFSGPVFTDELLYHARLESGRPITVDGEEHDGYGWFTLPDAYAKIKWSDDREALEKIGRLLTL